MNPVMFQWNSQADLPEDDPEKNSYYYGVLADQMDTLFPKLVYNHEKPYQLNYSEIIPICIKSIQELDKSFSNVFTGINRNSVELITDLTDTGSIIDTLKPRKFAWKNTTTDDIGFIADEMQSCKGNMIAVLVAEIKDLRKRMAILEASR